MGKHGVWDSEAVMILWVSCYFSSQLYFLVVFINCISQMSSSTIFLNCCIWNYGCPVKRLLPDTWPHPEDGQTYTPKVKHGTVVCWQKWDLKAYHSLRHRSRLGWFWQYACHYERKWVRDVTSWRCISCNLINVAGHILHQFLLCVGFCWPWIRFENESVISLS